MDKTAWQGFAKNRLALYFAVAALFFLTTTLGLLYAGVSVVTNAKLQDVEQCRFEVYGTQGIGYSIRLFNFTYSSAGAECKILQDTCSMNNVQGLQCAWVKTQSSCECVLDKIATLDGNNYDENESKA